MKRRDWLAALSLLSTRRRLDLRSPSFRAFVAAALQQQELLQAPYIHLTIHRLGVIGYSPALWQLTQHLQPLLQQQQLSSKQLAVCAWGLAKNGVTQPPVWELIALRDAKITKVFSVPLHKRPSNSSSSSRHRAYLPFRETVPLDCLPLLLPILKPAQVYSQGDTQAAGHAPATAETMPSAPPPEAAAPPPTAAATDAAPVPEAGVVGHTPAPSLGPTGEESPSVSAAVPAAAAAVAAAAKDGLRSSALLHSACTDVLLEVLCEETRLLRLDHTTNTSMVAALAEALADMQLVDPRLVYQLVLFSQQRGAAQFQGEQLLKVLEAFEGCQIADSKAWAKLVHRAQDVAADLDLKGLKRLRQLARRSGHSNARIEGVVDHFEALKEDVQRCGPL
ncbi:uncharacterized protein EMH_0001930 [Eimeria mitis]|uniref:Uncharacterized protein n=1 Tax=Eimeria mitis TaxID=44415 RepID=U6JYM9_9EIME|nr:uncharacterized protein EMH_0001930 [Eimeria mitis]CDJ28633.1 hypothetical protein EMH_0001930 [Eimeria mitis]